MTTENHFCDSTSLGCRKNLYGEQITESRNARDKTFGSFGGKPETAGLFFNPSRELYQQKRTSGINQ